MDIFNLGVGMKYPELNNSSRLSRPGRLGLAGLHLPDSYLIESIPNSFIRENPRPNDFDLTVARAGRRFDFAGPDEIIS
jgi:hypothetical protein